MAADSTVQKIRREYVNVAAGQVHIHGSTQIDGRIPLFLLHMTPLSSTVFKNVLPLFPDDLCPIAIDTPGFGGSDGLESPTIADYADVLIDVADVLGVERAIILGHHTGASIAVEVAVQAPQRVSGIVLSGVACATDKDAARRLSTKRAPEATETGSHIEHLWRRSREQHPRLSLNRATGYLAEELTAGAQSYLDAYTAVYTYPIEQRLGVLEELGIPVLLQYGSDDCIAGLQEHAADYLPSADINVLEGLTDFAADEDPEKFAAGIARFVNERIRQLLCTDKQPWRR